MTTIELFDFDEEVLVRNFPAVHGINMDELDRWIGTVGPTSYNPVFGAVAGEAQPNIGDTGSSTGLWYRLLDMVFVYGIVVWGGSGIDPGSGSNWFTVTLPVAALDLDVSVSTGAGACVGQAHVRDNSAIAAGSQTATVQLNTTTTAIFNTETGVSQRAFRHDIPIVWADGDRIVWSAFYRAATVT